jgi:hypothetical protein
MTRLYHLWLRATTVGESCRDSEARNSKNAITEVEKKNETIDSSPSNQLISGKAGVSRKWLPLPVSLVAVVALLASLASSGRSSETVDQAAPRAGSQKISGPTWRLPPAQVPSSMFGVTVNSSTGTMPTFRMGAVRFWDSATRWSLIQPGRATFDWTTLDRQIDGAQVAHLPSMFTFGGTPRWASPAGPAGPYPDGTPAPAENLADWDTFVRNVVQRYQGRIESYELWVLGNDPRFYAGSVEALVEMTRRASGIIRSVDPRATVVCPGMGQLGNSDAVATLRRFAELGGYGYCDVASVKLFQQSASDPPETMLEVAATLDRVLHEAGVHPRLWNTGTSYTIPLEKPLGEIAARNYAVRFFLVGLYARDIRLDRMYFYNWGGTRLPVVLQAVGGAPTGAALAVEQMQRWLEHAQSRSCGHGAGMNLPANVWQCEFTVTEGGRQRDAAILWTDTGTATLPAGPHANVIHRLDGGSWPVQPTDSITVTEEPVLIEFSASSP